MTILLQTLATCAIAALLGAASPAVSSSVGREGSSAGGTSLRACAQASVPAATLSNGAITLDFGPLGLTQIADVALGNTHGLTQDEFAITVDGTSYDSASLPAPSRTAGPDSMTYAWQAGPHQVDVVYELKPGWHFVSKQIIIRHSPAETCRLDEVTIFRATLAEPPRDVYTHTSGRQNLSVGDYGAFLRFEGSKGLLATAQNPFLQFSRDGSRFSLLYKPDMEWKREYGPFVADRGVLAPYRLTGRRQPARMLPEWQLGAIEEGTGLDEAEVSAFTEAVRAFLLYKPDKPSRVFVAWCVNDYQIDIATEEGRTEYKRILDRAAELGVSHVLFAPTNSDLGRREESVDDWSWENLLWLGLGQKIRKNEWRPGTSEIPATVREMLDHAKSKNLTLLAYVYPVLAFSQNPEWLVTRPNDAGGKKYGSLGNRKLQDWLIETLVAFHHQTGIAGYAFDHTFLGFAGPSRYAQWWGWRHVMEELRQRIPDIVVDGRQAYHLYGPWSWLAGSYPHPTYNDEQPESFVPFPDLSFDRVSAARQRYTAYRYRNHDFAPSEIVPGFITHQTSRADDTGEMPETKTARGVVLNRFRVRDWDYLGWRYSMLSSIATGGWNNVLNMIPARDLEEYRHFPEADKAWIRRWLEWADTNREFLRHTRTILGQPALGKVDGTAAIRDGRGYLFLFNPNHRRLSAELTLDASIGLAGKDPFLLKEIYPLEGRSIGRPGAGFWNAGDRVSIPMDGTSALVLEIGPAPATITVPAMRSPMLFGAPGAASLSGGLLELTGVRGEAGTTADLIVRVPSGQAVRDVRVNGAAVPFSQPSAGIVTVKARFDGAPFARAQQVGAYDVSFAGGIFKATFRVPRRVFDQLAARQKAWPIPWAPEDYRTPWLAPERLLLYVMLAELDDRWEPRLRIDGRQIELRRAYSAIRAARRTFVGFYADLSLISPDRDYAVEVELPPLKPGQFQGLFFENVETDYTDAIAR